MLRLLSSLLFVTLLMTYCQRAAHAEVESAVVKEALAAFNDLDYSRAITLLNEALSESLTREERIVIFKTLGFCHVALSDSEAARRDFEKLLEIDPSIELDRAVSPRVRTVFEKAKTRFLQPREPVAPVKPAELVTTLDPLRPSEGNPLRIRVDHVGDGRCQLSHRLRGQPSFSDVFAPTREGRCELTLPGMQVQSPALDYFLTVLDAHGNSLGAAGSLAQPLTVDVQSRPIYKRAAFWSLLGGTVAVATAATVLGVFFLRDPRITVVPTGP